MASVSAPRARTRPTACSRSRRAPPAAGGAGGARTSGAPIGRGNLLAEPGAGGRDLAGAGPK
eukprot:8132458-Alexandrium_andersonii.AAC.1